MGNIYVYHSVVTQRTSEAPTETVQTRCATRFCIPMAFSSAVKHQSMSSCMDKAQHIHNRVLSFEDFFHRLVLLYPIIRSKPQPSEIYLRIQKHQQNQAS